MIFNMVGGGGGSGATLVVSSPVNVSVTVSKDDKSYTKNSGSLGSTTFKGLATGTWTVTISGNGQTATRTTEITADYAITIAFFSASINITYPATSTCVVTNSGGQTVASDTNTGSSTKTWTATVNAKGTYTVTATATDGSGNTKAQSVKITSEGQSENVTLTYQLYLFNNGVVDGITWTTKPGSGSAKVSDTLYVYSPSNEYARQVASIYTTDKIDLTPYSKIHFTVSALSNNGGKCGVCSSTSPYDSMVAYADANAKGTFECDISSISEPLHIFVLVSSFAASFSLTVSKIWLD